MKWWVPLDDRPIWVLHHVPVWKERFVCLLVIPHPNPDILIFFQNRPGSDLSPMRYLGLAGHANACTPSVESETVITTFQIVTYNVSLGKRHMSMATAILESDYRAGPVTVHYQRFV